LKTFPKNIFDQLSTIPYLSTQQKLVLQILQLENCRISEILEAKWKNFFPGKFLILEGKKKSHNIIVRDRQILSSISSLIRLHDELIFYPVKYYQIFRLCLRSLNASVYVKGIDHSRKVTHFFRYQNARLTENEQFQTDILHHKSARSRLFYTSQTKKGNQSEKH